MAPEVLAQLGHGFCVDYWGLGMIVYEMMTGLPPWYTTDRAQLFRRLKSAPLDIPSYFSPASADCVSALLERNPRRRLGVTGIRAAMEHDFFRNISWRSLYSRRVEAPIQPCEGWRPPDAVVDGDHPEAFRSMSVQETHSSFAVNNGIEKMGSEDLDTATQNFDNQFLRMPVESEDGGQDSEEDHELYNDLSEDTFLGFTFDIVKEREKVAAASSPARQRTHHYQQASDPSQQRALE
jgi:serine/threonine protein kinase